MGDLPAGVDRAVIDAAVDAAFGAPDNEARVRSVVIVQGGRIVYERYHPLDGADVVYPSFSVAKSFTSALIGMLVDDGLLALDEHPAVPEWQAPGDPRQAITVRQMLQMSSGLEWTEEYGPESTAAAIFTAQDGAAVMAAQPLESTPGSTFEYSTGTSVLLAGIAADELGGCGAEIAYLEERLLGPIGITSETLATDGGGCWFGGFGADMTTRDFARFGLLYLRGGLWDGQQLIPTSWVDETRVPAATNPEYGLHWWLFRPGTFSAEGLFGQRIVVVPGSDLVIATNSNSGGDPMTMVDAILTAFGA
jgi:CubicO group peptidase (beta-lactamase class C family)